MAKKTKKPVRSQAEIKSGLKILRKRKLYKPKNPRAAPTKYALTLLDKYMDVTQGNASVVTASQKGRKGHGAAKKFNTGQSTPGTVRVKGNKIVVPKQPGERVIFDKKTGEVYTVRIVDNVRYIRIPYKTKIRTEADWRAPLRPDDRIAIPFNRGARGVEWQNLTQDEFAQFWAEYGPNGTKRKFKHLEDFIQIARSTDEFAEIDEEGEIVELPPVSGKIKRPRRAKKSGPRKSRGR